MSDWNIQADYARVCAALRDSRIDWLDSVSADVYWDRTTGDAATDNAVGAAMANGWDRATDFGLSLAFEYLRQNGLGDTLPGVVMPDTRDYSRGDVFDDADYVRDTERAHDAIIDAAMHVAALVCSGAAIVAGRAILEGN